MAVFRRRFPSRAGFAFSCKKLRFRALVPLFLVLSACGGSPDEAAERSSPTGPPSSPAGSPNGNGSRSPSSPSFDGRLIQVRVAGGEVTPRLGSVDVTQGQKVRIEVTADAADEVHLHGYDRRADVAPGQTGTIELDANIPGSFEVELENAGLKLFDLRVR